MSARKSPIRVVLADDHPVVLHGLEDLLRGQSGLTVVACCPDGSQALDAIRRLCPDVALVDMGMPGLSGLEVVRVAKRERLATRFVLLTAAADSHQVAAALAEGAACVLFKDVAAEVLVDCLLQIGAGKAFRIPQYQERRATQPPRWLSDLTSREKDIALLLAEGLSNKDVAKRAGVAEGTVKIHAHSIYKKLALSGRAGLITLALGSRR
jgi:two-component system nitrate/nitrite response regulator NarL